MTATEQKLIAAIVQAKIEFNGFFKLMNAGEHKRAGMCILEAETLLTKAVVDARSADQQKETA